VSSTPARNGGDGGSPPPGRAPEGALVRRLGLWSAISLMVSSMVGQGIFTTSGFMGHDLRHPPTVLALWAIGGLLALAGSLSYAELGVLIPRAGGEYAYLHRAFGPLAGFLSGWASFLAGFSAPTALCAIVLVECASDFFPALDPDAGSAAAWKLDLIPGAEPLPAGLLVGSGVILLLSLAHLRSVGLGVRVQNTLTLLKIAVVGLLVAAALASGRADVALLSSGEPLPALEAAPLAGRALLFVMMAYSGWNATSYMAGEVQDPRRVLPRAAVTGTLSVAVLYLLLNVAYFMAIPAGEMDPSPDVAVLAANHYFGAEGSLIISFVILVTQFGTISALVLAGSRVYYAMAEDGLAWRGLAKLSGPGRAPGRAVALQGLTAALMVLFIGDFESLVLYAAIILVLFSALSVAALPVLRRRIQAPPDSYGAPRGAPLLYITGSAAMLVSGGIFIWATDPKGALLAAGSILLGIPLYLLVRRVNGTKP